MARAVRNVRLRAVLGAGSNPRRPAERFPHEAGPITTLPARCLVAHSAVSGETC
jgi:hypothetical protein